MNVKEDIRLLLSRYLWVPHSLFWLRARITLRRFKSYFDSVEAHPLTDLQRLSVILNEPRNLVVAGAGTGKTSVLAAKAGYLLKAGICQPDEILLIAFNRRAAAELTERVKDRFGCDITVKTFHKLGYDILGEVLGEKPPVSALASDAFRLERLIQKTIDELLADDEAADQLLEFFLFELQPTRLIESFKSERDYRAYLQSLELRTLQGERVKSLGELDIANFLFVRGVVYQYEPRYKGEVPFNPNRRVYLPDFYLPVLDTYIEHFGLSRDGSPPKFLDGSQYLEDMDWKRKLHATNGTRLFESYSYQRLDGTLLRRLDALLKGAGVQYEFKTREQIAAALKKTEYRLLFAKLISAFLIHVRSNGWSEAELQTRAKSSTEPRRALAFLRLFSRVQEKYENTLREREEIDFSDMVVRAVDAATSGQWRSPFRYILVDEFQDLSVGRYRLIESLLKQKPNSCLFAVGDDWQAIYRFAGSDISLMTRFRERFGKCSVMKLDKTFRFDNSIETVSSQFVMKNPRQIAKRLKTNATTGSPSVTMHWQIAVDDNAIEEVVRRMRENRKPDGGTLLILSRYRHDLPDSALLTKLSEIWSPGTIETPKTVHAAKGAEADYVLITDLVSGRYGFPSEIVDDPLLDMVLAEPEDFAHAEERRLFYVALTRARLESHIITTEGEPSTFAEELSQSIHQILHVRPYKKLRCPQCGMGVIRRRKTGRYGCSNLAECGYTAPACPECDEGYLWRDTSKPNTAYRCSAEECEGTAATCPRCNTGALVQRTGKFGDFYGCSEYPACKYSIDLKKLRRIRAASRH